MTEVPPEPASGDPSAPPLAAPAQRLAGALVDGALFQVAGLALIGVDQRSAGAITAVAYLAYEVAMVVWRGQTLAKMALGTRVVDGVSGRVPTLWQAATRAVVPLAGVVADAAMGSAGVGALWVFVVYGSVAVDGRHRGLHDRAAGTLVVADGRSPAHRRVGLVAVAVAVAFTVVAVAVAVDDLDDGQPGARAAALRDRSFLAY
ncbi:MAG: RDD family protein [Actinomycetota bacterium]